jgi:hypothetical protein
LGGMGFGSVTEKTVSEESLAYKTNRIVTVS